MDLLDLFGLVGLTIILVWSTLFRWLQNLWRPLFACPMCLGFWVGLVGSVLLRGGRPYPDHLAQSLGSHFLVGCVVSYLAFASYLVLVRVDGGGPQRD